MAVKIVGENGIVNESEAPLREAVINKIKETGSLSQNDLSTIIEKEGTGEAQGAEMQTTTKIEVPDGREPIIKAAGAAPTPEQDLKKNRDMNELDQSSAGIPPGDLEKALTRRRVIEITPADKQAFVDALIHDKRMVMEFNPCGGTLSVVIRSRTIPETRAIVARQRFEIDSELIKTRVDYNVRVRSMLMAAQVQSVNGTEYPELPEPLMPQASPDGKDTPPAWLEWVDSWANKHEHLHSIIWACLEEFEDKYWRMVEDAKQQDFWQPATSISA